MGGPDDAGGGLRHGTDTGTNGAGGGACVDVADDKREGGEMNIFEIADALAGQNIGSFQKVLADLQVGYVMGVLEGAGYYTRIPTVLIHSNEPHGRWIRFTVVYKAESTCGSISDSWAPITSPAIT